MNPLFELRPISDPPKESGWYIMIDHKGKAANAEVKNGQLTIHAFNKESTVGYLAPLAEPVEGMRWVKASVRLPVLNNQRSREFCCRWTDNMGSNRFVQTYTEKHGFCISEGNLPYLEWLDESASSTPSTQQTKLSQMRDLVRKVYARGKEREAELEREVERLRKGIKECVVWFADHAEYEMMSSLDSLIEHNL